MSNNRRLAIKNVTVHRDGEKVQMISFDVFLGSENLGQGVRSADGAINGKGRWIGDLGSNELLRVERMADRAWAKSNKAGV